MFMFLSDINQEIEDLKKKIMNNKAKIVEDNSSIGSEAINNIISFYVNSLDNCLLFSSVEFDKNGNIEFAEDFEIDLDVKPVSMSDLDGIELDEDIDIDMDVKEPKLSDLDGIELDEDVDITLDEK